MELLRTPRLLLRRWQDDDLAAYFDIYSRWEVMRWLGAPPRRAVADLDEARERLTDRWFGITTRQFAGTGDPGTGPGDRR